MKKLLILLALAACAACNTEDDNDNRQTATFEGTLTITSNQTPSATPFVTNNISFELTEATAACSSSRCTTYVSRSPCRCHSISLSPN